jgi:hypothetical protein
MGDHDAAMGAIQNQNTFAQQQYGGLQNQFQNQMNQWQNQQNNNLGQTWGGITGLNKYTGGNYINPYASNQGTALGAVNTTGQGNLPTTQSTSFANMGGGWQDSSVSTPSASVLSQAFAKGLTGQDAVDWATQNGAPGIAYYSSNGTYGLPDGAYAAPNASNGQLDLISRGGGGSAPNVFGISTDPGADTRAGYSQLAQGLGPDFYAKVDPYFTDLNQAIGSYQNFINTGGFSDADKQNMIAAAIAPTRQVYSNMQDELTRQQAISGGNLGNIGVASANLASQGAGQIGAQNVQAQSNLAQLVQQGKEFGTTGEAQASLAGAQAQTAIAQLDAQMREAGLGGLTADDQMQLQAQLTSANLANQDRLAQLQASYGLTQMGNQNINTQQQLQSNLLNAWNQGNLENIRNQISASNIPGNFQSAMGNIGSGLGLLSNLVGAGSGGGLGNMLGNLGGGGGDTSTYQPGTTYPQGLVPGTSAADIQGGLTGPLDTSN